MNKSGKIVAVKDGKERSFSELAWKLMGKDKNGYILVPDEATKQKQRVEDDKKGQTKDNSKKVIEDAKKQSKDFTADGAIIELKKIETIEALNEFAVGEKRENIINAIKRRDVELTTAAQLDEEAEALNGAAKSNDEGVSVREAMKVMEEMLSAKEINSYVAEDENRKTILEFQTKRLAEISEG